MKLGTTKMLAEKEGAIGWMIYNNPERHNALSLEMQAAIPEILEAFAGDEEVRVVVMRGAGDKSFISGADISEFESERSTSEARENFDRIASLSRRAFVSFQKPLLAMIGGYCMGGGLATALAADIRIASEDSQFAIPAARLGVGYGFGGLKKLIAIVGPAYAAEIMFSARRFSAEEAWRMGLVNRVVGKDELEAEVRGLASRIAENAPLTIKASKFAIGEAQKDPEKRDLETSRLLTEACFRSEDYTEGRRAFMEKRKPRFRGR